MVWYNKNISQNGHDNSIGKKDLDSAQKIKQEKR